MWDYILCGWLLLSDRPLPLLKSVERSGSFPDIEVRHAPIFEVKQSVKFQSPFVTLYADGKGLIRINEKLSILVAEGRYITVDAKSGVSPEEVMTFLLGPALGLLCHQRQVLVLHAASIQVGDKAVALVGHSGAGKSTCATALVNRGHRLLCDDIAVIDAPQATVAPSYPGIKLWQDAADNFSIPTVGLKRTREELKKFHYPTRADFGTAPVELGAIILLYPRAYVSSAELVRLDKIKALAQLAQQVYRRKLAASIGAESASFRQLGQLVSRVPVMSLMRPEGFSSLDGLLDLVEQAVLT